MNTYLVALGGGAVVGLAVALLVLMVGRIAGISGVLGGLLRAGAGDRLWRVAFLAGLMAAPWVWRGSVQPHIDAGWPLLIAAGLLVGVGTRYAGGCTSGHGVCGLSRRSPRSLVATAVFMATGFATVFIVRHLL